MYTYVLREFKIVCWFNPNYITDQKGDSDNYNSHASLEASHSLRFVSLQVGSSILSAFRWTVHLLSAFKWTVHLL